MFLALAMVAAPSASVPAHISKGSAPQGFNLLTGGKVLGSERARKYVSENVTPASLEADYDSIDERFTGVPDAAMMADIIEVLRLDLCGAQMN